MTREEVPALIVNGENSGVEFKRDPVRAERLAPEMVALAVCRGGAVLLGVEDDGAISGIRRKDLERWVMDTVFGVQVHPMILPFHEEVRVDADRRVAVVGVAEGVAKPMCCATPAARTRTSGWGAVPGSPRANCWRPAGCCAWNRFPFPQAA